MVPAAYVVLESLPLTPNGKLDRRALPAPKAHNKSDRWLQTPLEETLCAIFAEILGIEKIGLHDNFFEMGGHSLMVSRLVRKIHQTLGIKLAISSLFESPTIAQLIVKKNITSNISPFDVILPIRVSGDLPPLFLIHPLYGLSWCYAGLLKYLNPRRPVYGIQAQYFTSTTFYDTIEEAAIEYTKRIRGIQATGPYHLAGWSLGGILAHEIACLLQREGEKVVTLSLFDAKPFIAFEAELPNSLEKSEPTIDREAPLHEIENEPLNLQLSYSDQLQKGRLSSEFTEAHYAAMKKAYLISIESFQSFVPKRYRGDLIIYAAKASKNNLASDVARAWSPYVDGHIHIYLISCTHDTILNAKSLIELGPLFAAEIDKF
jgi:pristinamycin I synthase-3/4